MRIKNLNLAWFRGAAHNADLECKLKSIVVYGANGSGKSSFADALEYIVAQGRVCHLSHEYSGKRQEKGIRNTHAPEDALSKISLELQYGSKVNTTIDLDGSHTAESDPSSLLEKIQSWDLERFILRQDEVANFIHATKGEKYSVLLPLLGLENLEQTATNLRLVISALTDRSNLVTKQQRLSSLEEEASKLLTTPTRSKAMEALKELAATYIEGVAPIKFDDLLEALDKEIEARISSATPEQNRHRYFQEIVEEELNQKLVDLDNAEKDAAKAFDVLLERRIAVLEPTSDFIEELDPELKMIDCPACGNQIAVDDFDEHVKEELESLSAAREARDKVVEARQQFSASLGQVLKRTRRKELREWLKDTRRKDLKAAIDGIAALDLGDLQDKWSQDTWAVLNANVPLITSKVKSAAKRAPPSTKELIHDEKVLVVCKGIPEIASLKNQISKIKTIISGLKKAEALVRGTIQERTESTIEDVSEWIQRLWSTLHPDEPIEDVMLYIPEDAEKAIDISLKFFGVDQPSPRLTLSEGHRNSMGLCIFLALVLQDADKDRPIILDDVVSSLDREHRGMLAKILLEDLADRQVILLTHDREWFSELRMRLPSNKWKFQALRPWENPQVGIQWGTSTLSFDDARKYQETDPEVAGNNVRRIMDTQLAIAAENLKVKMEFARGDRNDRRTCIELIERIYSEAKDKYKMKLNGEYEDFSPPLNTWNTAKSLLISWANRASHTGTLAKNEVKELINICEESIAHFYCNSCKDPVWISDQEKRKRFQCSCGALRWKYGS